MSCRSNIKKCKGQFFGNMVYFEEIIDFGQKTLTGLPQRHFCDTSDFHMQIGFKHHQRGLDYLIVYIISFIVSKLMGEKACNWSYLKDI